MPTYVLIYNEIPKNISLYRKGFHKNNQCHHPIAKCYYTVLASFPNISMSSLLLLTVLCPPSQVNQASNHWLNLPKAFEHSLDYYYFFGMGDRGDGKCTQIILQSGPNLLVIFSIISVYKLWFPSCLQIVTLQFCLCKNTLPKPCYFYVSSYISGRHFCWVWYPRELLFMHHPSFSITCFSISFYHLLKLHHFS